MATQSTAGFPVRRQNRALTREQALNVIRKSTHATVGTCDTDGNPYVCPVTPVLLGDDKLYFHCAAAPGGRRSTNLGMNPRVSVCFIAADETLPEQFSVNYASAVVSGRATLVTDEAERHASMQALLARHAPGNTPEHNKQYIDAAFQFVAMWRIDIESVTGKARDLAAW